MSIHADPAKPSTAPAPALTDRQASLLMQLSEAEANIKTINQALIRTGYKVGLAYQQIESSQKGNEIMDRKGGGPVGWEQFYGSTAAGFNYHSSFDVHAQRANGYSTLDAHANGSRLTPIQRPQQFDYIYRANDEQVSRAQEQIAALSQNQAALLTRRQQHEMNQSRIWTEFSWEQIRDQEIPFRPLYRFKLQPDDVHTAVLRGPVLFLRTADKALALALDSMDGDQSAVFSALSQRIKTAYGALQESMADVMYSPQLSPTDAKDADAIKTLCKNVTEECSVIADNFTQAMQSDAAKEDASKLAYRAQLQSSLARLSTLMSDLDHHINTEAATWHITPISGTASADTLPTWSAAPTATNTPAIASTPTAAPTPIAIAPHAPLTANCSLLNALTVGIDANCDRRDDCLRISLIPHHFDGHMATEVKFATPLIITAVAKTSAKELRLFYGDQGIIVLAWGGRGDILRYYDPQTGRQKSIQNCPVPPDEFVTLKWVIGEDQSSLEINGRECAAFHGDYHGLIGRIGIGTHGDNIVTVKSLCVNRAPSPPADQTPPPR
jgi:hypothetical protein